MNKPVRLTSYVLAGLCCCFMIAVTLIGCGGGNNPSGATVISDGTVSQTLTSGSASIQGRVLAEGQTAIGGIVVELLTMNVETGAIVTPGKSFTTQTSGQFTFQNLSTGTFVLRVQESTQYLESSKLAVVNTTDSTIDTGDFAIFKKNNADTKFPTIDIRARILDPLSKNPLSVAQVSADSGQTTVTNRFGIFSLSNLASGTRRISVSQPGTASFTVSFDVIGVTAPNANSIQLDGTVYNPNVATEPRRIDFVIYGKDFTVNPNLHPSGTLFGTVTKYQPGNKSVEIPYPNFQFELWTVDPDKITVINRTVSTKADGTWRVDNLPPNSDNGFLWLAVATGTSAVVNQSNSGNVSAYSNQNLPWYGPASVPFASRTIQIPYIFGNGYQVKENQTTTIDFLVPLE